MDAGLAGKFPFKYTYTLVKPSAERLAIISDLIEHKKVHVHVSKVLPLEKARCAPGCSFIHLRNSHLYVHGSPTLLCISRDSSAW